MTTEHRFLGSSTTFYCDGYWVSNGGLYIYTVGGAHQWTVYNGPYCIWMEGTEFYTNDNVGASISVGTYPRRAHNIFN